MGHCDHCRCEPGDFLCYEDCAAAFDEGLDVGLIRVLSCMDLGEDVSGKVKVHMRLGVDCMGIGKIEEALRRSASSGEGSSVVKLYRRRLKAPLEMKLWNVLVEAVPEVGEVAKQVDREREAGQLERRAGRRACGNPCLRL